MDTKLEVGKIVNTHGLKGEVKIVPWTDYPEVFENIPFVYAKKKKEEVILTLSGIKYQKNNLIVKFKELENINEAELLKNCVIYAERENLPPLEEGVYYIKDLIDCKVYDEHGGYIGIISDVFNNGASDIYAVSREKNKDLLIPVIDDTILSVDIENKRVDVKLIEGLDEL